MLGIYPHPDAIVFDAVPVAITDTINNTSTTGGKERYSVHIIIRGS